MGRIREEKRRRKKIKEKKMRRKKIQVREKIIKIRKNIFPRIYGYGKSKNPPAPNVVGRDLPDGTRKRLQVYLGGGGFFGQNLLFLIGRDARLQKTL